MTQKNPETLPEEPRADMPKRKRLFAILGAIVLVAGLGTWAYLSLYAGHRVSTEDAYVHADIAQVTPSIQGIVQSVDVMETQTVSKGDVLVTIDSADMKLALARAEADLASAQATLQRAQSDVGRREKLAKIGGVSREELSTAQSGVLTAQATLAAAQTARDQAAINLDRTIIRAPIDGVIAERRVEIGQHVQPGAPFMTVVPLSEAYVEANYKEVQLDRVKPGQKAELVSDLYGDDIVYHGTVEGLSGGTGSAFAIIPAQNATGNWIKVVQRVPVRIKMDPQELKDHPLRVGLSMKATILLDE